jgi:hypothetical protein
MGFQGYVIFHGTNQGKFKGGSTLGSTLAGGVRRGGAPGFAIAQVVATTIAAPGAGSTNGQLNGYSTVLRLGPWLTVLQGIATGRASGKRQWTPIKLLKEWDSSSSQIQLAAFTNEILKSVSIQIVSSSNILHTIVLTNARIVNLVRYSTTGNGTGRAQEELTLTYEDSSVNGLRDPSFPQMLARIFPAGRA